MYEKFLVGNIVEKLGQLRFFRYMFEINLAKGGVSSVNASETTKENLAQSTLLIMLYERILRIFNIGENV